MLSEFIQKHTGKKIGSGQCVALYRQYIKETYNTTSPLIPGAKDIWDKPPQGFEKIENTPTFIPRKGDIIIWNGRLGKGYGHVGVVVDANVNTFRSFEQNPYAPKIVTRKYSNVIGFLRKKIEKMPKINKGVPVETNNQWHPAIGQAVVVEQRNNNTETRIKASDWFDQWVPTYKLEILNRELDTKALESNIRRVAELEKLVKEKGKNLKKAQDLASERAKGLKIKDKELERLSKELKIRKAYIDQIYKLYTV